MHFCHSFDNCDLTQMPCALQDRAPKKFKVKSYTNFSQYLHLLKQPRIT